MYSSSEDFGSVYCEGAMYSSSESFGSVDYEWIDVFFFLKTLPRWNVRG
jgi:hypothetical protein